MHRFFAKSYTYRIALTILLLLPFGIQKASAQCSKSWTFKVITNTGCIKKNGRPIQIATSPVVAATDSVSIKWDFGDGKGFVPGGDTVWSPAYQKGIHKVRMLITNNKSGKFLGDTCSMDSQNVFINGIGTPVVKAANLKFCSQPFFIQLYDSTTGPIKIRQWLIKSSKGNASGYFNSKVDSSGSNTDTFTIPKYGNYDVLLQVTDSYGCVTFDTLPKYIFLPVPLQPDICTQLTFGRYHRDSVTAKFSPTNLTSGLDVTGAKYFWDFGDGKTDTAKNPTHIYTGIDTIVGNSKSVKLKITLKNGCTDSFTQQAIITKYYWTTDTPNNIFCTGSPAAYHITQTALSGGKQGYTYVTSVSSSKSGKDPLNPNFTFTTNGLSDMTLAFVYNGASNRCAPSVTIPALYNILPPKADFTCPDQSNTTCIKPAKVFVKSLNAYKGAKYYWYVYDTSLTSPRLITSQVVTTDTTTLTLGATDSGFFAVKLKIIDPNGGKLTCEDSVTKNNFISVNSPIPAFTVADTIVCAGKTLSIKNLTSPKDTITHPYSYSWSTTRRTKILVNKYNGKKPSIEMDSMGVFDLQLTVTISKACKFISTKQAIYVDGTAASIKSTAINTCIGSGKAKASVVISSANPSSPVFGKTGGIIWKSSDSANTKFTPTTAQTKIDSTDTAVVADFSKSSQKTFDIQVLIINSSGCSTVVKKSAFLHLGTKAIVQAPKVGCSKTPIQFKDQSLYNPDSFYWSCIYKSVATSIVTIDSPYSKQPKIIFSTPGTYVIKHSIGIGDLNPSSGCYKDTVDTIKIVHPHAYFMSFNQYSGCAPQIISFDSIQQRNNVQMYYWDYGDKMVDSTTDTTGWYHIYATNNPSGFDVQLVVKDSFGCLDTFKRTSYIHLNGPVPKFTLNASSACGDSTITITNNSVNITDLSLDFRDGSPAYNGNFTSITHDYKYTDLSKDSLVYFLQMVASDKSTSTCYATYTDSIKLYRPPVARIGASNSFTGCAPYTIHFLDQSNYNDTLRNQWDFNNDGIIDAVGVANPSHTYTVPGNYSVRLLVSTAHCADSTIIKTIVINGKPKANFIVDKDTTCPSDFFTFTPRDTNMYSSTITSYSWDFGDTTTYNYTVSGSTIATDTTPTHKYTYGGFHDVQLIITNSFGCMDTLLKPAFVYTIPFRRPDSPIVLSVSVDLNAQNGTKGAIIVKWKKDVSGNFTKFDLFRSDMGYAGTPIWANITNPSTDTYYDNTTDVYDNSYGYALDRSDLCGFTSFPGAPHYTMVLRTTPNPIGTAPYINLIWSNYVGWSTITNTAGLSGPVAYQVWRNDNKTPGYTLIGTVNRQASGSIDTTFTDSNNVCNGLYKYYIVAVHPTDSTLNSNSNRDSASPNYTFQTKRLDLLYTTVVNDKYTVTRWTGSMQPNVKAFIIDRMDSSGNWINGYDSLGPNQDSFVDYRTHVNRLSYRYRVKVVDKCGNITDGQNPNEAGPSNWGTSILLQAGVVGQCPNEQFSFLWVPYDSFNAGVDHYVLQIKDASGNWVNYKNLNATKDSAGDDSIHQELNGPACYRIVAYSKPDPDSNLSISTSISNSRCLLNCSRLYLPDAFTPNGDGLNDSFAVVSVAVFNGINPVDLQYSFKIFNRWGELVWSTNDLHAKWGGQFGNDHSAKAYKECPVDIYIYQIEAHGMDKQIFFKKGIITLLK